MPSPSGALPPPTSPDRWGGICLVDGRQHFGAGQIVQLLDAVQDGVPFFRFELGKFVEDFGETHERNLDGRLCGSKPPGGMAAGVDFLQLADVDLGIDRGGFEAFMP